MWLQAPVFPLDNGDFNSQPTQDQSTGSSLQRGGKMNAGVNFQKTVQKMWPFFKKTRQVKFGEMGVFLFLQLLPRRTHIQCRENRNILQHLSGDSSNTL